MMGVGGELDGVFAAHQTPLVVVLGSPDDLGGYKDGLALAIRQYNEPIPR
jgi:hypothetical protein